MYMIVTCQIVCMPQLQWNSNVHAKFYPSRFSLLGNPMYICINTIWSYIVFSLLHCNLAVFSEPPEYISVHYIILKTSVLSKVVAQLPCTFLH